MQMPIKGRFDKKYITVPECGCWLWEAACNNQGYGVFQTGTLKASKLELAHRMAWRIYKGNIPEGSKVLHICDTPLCVNPNHLFLGTIQDNARDMVKKKRSTIGERNPAAKLTEENVRDIKNDNRSGYAIAKDYNVSSSAIYLIRRRENWRHV